MKKLYDIDEQTQIDKFGVDHSNFSLRDEIEYNFRRAKEKERQQSLMPNAYENDYLGRLSAEQRVKNQQNINPNIVNSNLPKNISNNTSSKIFSPGEIAWSGITGMAQGIAGSLEHSLNTLSDGRYDLLLDDFGDNGYEKRQQALENLAAQENLQKPLKHLNYFNDAVIGAYGGAKLKQIGKIPGFMHSLYKNMK